MMKVALSVVAVLVFEFITVNTASPCDPRCFGQGTCQGNGRCLCYWGWTGPKATYITSGSLKNRILADYCIKACPYGRYNRNPVCASIRIPTMCDPSCNTGVYSGLGRCLSNGRCLCWWGWTGPNASFVNGGSYNNRIMADKCIKPCNYNNVYRNVNCITSKKPPTPITSPRPSTAAKQVPSCDPRCTPNKAGMKCESDGRCLCWWGWTGPNATYITSGALNNRILADYCTTPCHYTHDYRNPSCARFPTPPTCSVPVNKTVPPLPCDPDCGTGTYHSAGKCLSNGRCLCWWGWTGPNACYVDGGTYNNRIIADSCIRACHYTHDYRNMNCTKAVPTTKPSAQSPGTGNPTTTRTPSTGQPGTVKLTTGKPSTVKPTTGQPRQPSTVKPTTEQPSTVKPTTGQPSTVKPTTGQPSTVKPTTRQPSTVKPTTGQPSTVKASTGQPSTKKQTTSTTTTTAPKQTSTIIPSTQQTTSKGVTTTTAQATTMQPATTTKTKNPTTNYKKTTTQGVPKTTAKATTTQAATTEPPEPTEPSEPTEPTEPGDLQIRGMAANQQNQLQNDVDVEELKDDEQKEDKEKKFSPTALVIVGVVLLLCVLGLVTAVWWTYGNGSQFPSLLRGYEPVGNADSNMMMRELSESAPLP